MAIDPTAFNSSMLELAADNAGIISVNDLPLFRYPVYIGSQLKLNGTTIYIYDVEMYDTFYEDYISTEVELYYDHSRDCWCAENC